MVRPYASGIQGGNVSRNSESPLVIRNKILLPAIYTFMGLCLLLSSVLVLTQPLTYAENPLLLFITLGVVGFPVSVAIVIVSARGVVRRRNAIVIDERGIADNTGFMAPGFIPWDQIAEVFLLKLKDDTYLCVVPTDTDAWLASLSCGRRQLAQANLDAGFAPIRIQFKKVTDRHRAQDGLAAVRSFHPEKVTRVRKPKY